MEEHVEYILTKDAVGNTLTGEKNYGFHLAPNIPAKEYWSVIVYDSKQLNNQEWTVMAFRLLHL